MEKAADRIRIVTLNTWKCDGEYLRRLEEMVQQLETLDPDVICLQEAFQSLDGQYDTAQYISRRLGYRFYFTPSRRKSRKVEGETIDSFSGLAVLSRYKMAKPKVLPLTVCGDDHDRIAMSVDLLMGERKIRLTNLHLTHIHSQEDVSFQKWQFRDLLLSFARDLKDESFPWLCCGDYNWIIDSVELQELHSETGVRITDCYRQGKGAMPGYTFYDSSGNGKRIDYILNLSSVGKNSFTWANAKVVCNRVDPAAVAPSDHYGVAIELTLS